MMVAVPGYVATTPDKQYRKNPSTYLYNKSWNNEIVRGQGNGAISNSWTAEDAAGIGAYYSTEEE